MHDLQHKKNSHALFSLDFDHDGGLCTRRNLLLSAVSSTHFTHSVYCMSWLLEFTHEATDLPSTCQLSLHCAALVDCTCQVASIKDSGRLLGSSNYAAHHGLNVPFVLGVTLAITSSSDSLV